MTAEPDDIFPTPLGITLRMVKWLPLFLLAPFSSSSLITRTPLGAEDASAGTVFFRPRVPAGHLDEASFPPSPSFPSQQKSLGTVPSALHNFFFSPSGWQVVADGLSALCRRWGFLVFRPHGRDQQSLGWWVRFFSLPPPSRALLAPPKPIKLFCFLSGLSRCGRGGGARMRFPAGRFSFAVNHCLVVPPLFPPKKAVGFMDFSFNVWQRYDLMKRYDVVCVLSPPFFPPRFKSRAGITFST